MDRKSVHKGLFGSIALHLVIMLIPLSTTVVREFEEIELIVIDEKPVIKKETIEKPNMPTVSKAVDQEAKKEPIQPPIPPLTEEQSPVNQTFVEPEKEVIEDPQEENPEITKPPVAVEPPITFAELIPEVSPKSQSPPLPQTVVPAVLTKTAQTTEPTTVPRKTLDGAPDTETSSSKPSPSVLEDVPFGSEVAPKFVRREMPIYPLLARRLGKEGKVLLRLTIDERGNLLGVEVIEKASYGFTEAAVEAVKKSTFLPAQKNGKPVTSRALLPIRFRLERN